MLRAASASKPTAVYTLAQSAVAVSCPSDTTEDTLATITIPAGTMGANGSVVINCLFSFTNSANNKTLHVKFGGTTYASSTVTTTSMNSLVVGISNRATASQVGWFPLNPNPFTAQSASPVTSTVDTTADVVILITGQKALNTETLTLERYSVEVRP